MNPDDMGPILMQVERQERQEWRRKQEAALSDDLSRRMPTQRALRARHFASQIVGMLSKFIPEACVDEAVHELMVNAYGHDLEIAQVPPERDAEREAALRAAELMPPGPIIIP